jgi:selenocysteine-specific elongation factor
VDRSFAAQGSGTVVTGTLTGGTLAVDQHIDVVPAGRGARIRSIQSNGRTVSSIGAGNRVALNLAGVDHHEIARGDAVLHVAQWRPSRRVDATLQVLQSLDHDVSRRGAYAAYIGSGEWPVKVRIIGPDAIQPGQVGTVRLHLTTALPLVRGDRFILRESGRNETIGGGEVLDVAPVLPASKAHPDSSLDRIVAERRWTTVDDLLALTGEHVAATIGKWVVSPQALATMATDLRERVAIAVPLGLDLATLDERERAVLATLADVRVEGGRALPADAVDEFADHPVLEALRASGAAPPEPTGIDRATLRELVRRGLLVERDGIHFHPSAIDRAASVTAELLRHQPEGITMSQLRDALGVSRKYALPLANELDARGITRRRGDLRIAGPRLSVD